MDNASKKKDIRARFLLQREALPQKDRLEKSRLISDRFLRSTEFRAAQSIHFYLAAPSEVQTDEMIRSALRLNKRVAVPIIDSANRSIALSEWAAFDREKLQPGPFGILQPRPEFRKEVKLEKIDLWVIPGVAFDLSGNRLGFGGGYYDRLLVRAKGVVIGLAFEAQISSELPVIHTDRKVDMIITEGRTIFCGGRKRDGGTD